jgi:hypothetical protein
VEINGREVRSCGRYEDVPKLHVQRNNILLDVTLGKIYKKHCDKLNRDYRRYTFNGI